MIPGSFYYKIRVEIDIPAVSSSSFGIFRFFKRKIPQKFPKKGIFYGKLFPREVPDLLIKGKSPEGFINKILSYYKMNFKIKVRFSERKISVMKSEGIFFNRRRKARISVRPQMEALDKLFQCGSSQRGKSA